MDTLLNNKPLLTLIAIILFISFVDLYRLLSQKQFLLGKYLHYIGMFFFILLIAEVVSFYFAAWGFGILSFMALREYFSLVDLRLQDRIGILAAYFSIPFMMHYVHTDWYNMFIITIPVYSFLVIPFLISIAGKETEGAIYAIGTIDFGLFIFVYCIGHLAYLCFFSTWMAGMLLLNITICDITSFYIEDKMNTLWKKIIVKYLIPVPITITLTLLLSNWTGIPQIHSIILGSIIPALVLIGNHTITYFESDLGIVKDSLRPGRELLIDNIKSVLYTAPGEFQPFKYGIGKIAEHYRDIPIVPVFLSGPERSFPKQVVIPVPICNNVIIGPPQVFKESYDKITHTLETIIHDLSENETKWRHKRKLKKEKAVKSIAILGIDGSGKSTLSKNISKRLSEKTSVALVSDKLEFFDNNQLKQVQPFISENIRSLVSRYAKNAKSLKLYKIPKLTELLLRDVLLVEIKKWYCPDIIVLDGAALLNLIAWAILYKEDSFNEDECLKAVKILASRDEEIHRNDHIYKNFPELATLKKLKLNHLT